MRCDGRTFTETNGNIVSGKADRAVNRSPNMEQINISRNSSVFSDYLCCRQKMHRTLSGHFSPRTSRKKQFAVRRLLWSGDVLKLRPPRWTGLPRCRCRASCGQERAWAQAFSPTTIHHEIPFVMSLAELSRLMMLSLPAENTEDRG